MSRLLRSFLFISLFLTGSLFSAVYYVEPDTVGADWYDMGSYYMGADLATAISTAASGDTIFVAAGTYPGFALKEGVKMFGGFNGGETSVNHRAPKIFETILTRASGSILTAGTGITSATLLDGFVIADGNADAGNGGGMYINGGASPQIKNCIFRNNTAANGGVVYIGAAATNITFEYCLFEGNSATTGGVVDGINNNTLTTNFNFSTFVSNTATNGSVIASNKKNIVNIASCVFWNNPGTDLYAYGNPPGTISVSTSGADFTYTGVNITYVTSPFLDTTYYYLKTDDTSGYGWIGKVLKLNCKAFIEGSL